MTVTALAVTPGASGSASVEVRPEPIVPEGWLTVQPTLVGICGTDLEILAGGYGQPPPGTDRLVIGHESCCRVLSAPPGSGFDPGELVVPIVRRPDPVPCAACAAGEWDRCRNGRFTELGINGLDGMARTRFPLDPAFAVRVPERLGDLAVLVEPASVVAKAWDLVDKIRTQTASTPGTVLVTGAGPVGLLAALMARQREHETHVLDLVTSGPKPAAVAAIGATYHPGLVADLDLAPDIVIECTGIGSVVLDAIARSAPNATVCLTGISSGVHTVDFDAAAFNRRMVLENDVVLGSVNANRRHYAAAVDALVAADRRWLEHLVTRRIPIQRWTEALTREPTDIKVCLDLGTGEDSLPEVAG